MKLSPLQLLDYFVGELHFSLNSRYDAKKKLDLKASEFSVESVPNASKENPRQWTVALDLKYQPAAETNTPYVFSLALVGIFRVSSKLDDAKVERLVRVNGASILYGIAREIIREQTARGPDGPFVIPSASFLEDEHPVATANPPIAEASEPKQP